MYTLEDTIRLLIKREQAYQDHTDEVWATVPYLTTGILNYLDLPIEDVKWDSMDVINDEVIVTVTVPFTDRFRWVASHEKTEQILTIALPMMILETYSEDDITKYLIETEDVRKMGSEDDDEEEAPSHGIVAYANVTKKVIH